MTGCSININRPVELITQYYSRCIKENDRVTSGNPTIYCDARSIWLLKLKIIGI